MTRQSTDREKFLTPADVAAMLSVDPRTVTRWAIAGKIGSVRTPGGHRRLLKSDVVALMSAGPTDSGSMPGPADSAPTAPSDSGLSPDTQSRAQAAVVAEAVATARQSEAGATAQAATVVARAVTRAADRAAEADARARRTAATAHDAAAASGLS